MVKRTFKYIAAAFMCVFAALQARAQESLDIELERYERMCAMCLELRTRMDRGEQLSRDEAKATLDIFVASNKRLKTRESGMTALQRQRFKDIGEWFTTGVKPQRPVQLPYLTCSLPSVRLAEEERTIILPSSVSYEPYAKPLRVEFIALAEVSAPNLSYGLKAGLQGRKFGVYVSYKSNFSSQGADYQCRSDGKLDSGSCVWLSGETMSDNMIAAAGVLAPVAKWSSLYAGAGYGCRTVLWQDVDGNWVEVSDLSYKGLAMEAGALFKWKHLAFSLGLSSVKLKTYSFTAGVGVCF